MIAVIDMKIGNLQSVLQAFARVGAGAMTVTSRPEDVAKARAIVLPGVGSFGDGMASLRENGLVAPLQASAQAGVPLLGICLGMQLLADTGEEHGRQTGLGLVRARAVRLRPTDPGCRVPNIGWCDVTLTRRDGALFSELNGTHAFYFAHSYHLICDDPAVCAATLDYGSQRVTAAIEQGNLCGVQFHPEKSQDAGLAVLASFVSRIAATV